MIESDPRPVERVVPPQSHGGIAGCLPLDDGGDESATLGRSPDFPGFAGLSAVVGSVVFSDASIDSWPTISDRVLENGKSEDLKNKKPPMTQGESSAV